MYILVFRNLDWIVLPVIISHFESITLLVKL